MNEFDPLHFAQFLNEQGVNPEDSVLFAKATRDIVVNNLVSKKELARYASYVDKKIDQAIQDVRHEIELAKRDMTIRFGLIAATVGAGVFGALTFALK